MAAGVAIRSKPVRRKQFLHISKRDRIDKLKFEHGKNWKKHFRAEKKKYVHFRPRTQIHGQIDVQERRVRKKSLRRKLPVGTTLRGAGSLMIAAGRLVPSMAAGAVAMSYIETQEGRPITQTDVLGGNVRVDTEALSQDAAKIHAMMRANIEQGVFLVSSAWYLGKAAKERIL